MIIELQEPFRSSWSKGYLRVDGTGRRRIDLYNTDTDRTTISYARYLVSVHLGYILSRDYEVDHVNDDQSDDRLNNYQILTQEENKFKQNYNYIMNHQVCYGYYCACCESPFILVEAKVKMRLDQNVKLAFCSRSCSARYHYYMTRHGVIS